MMSSISTISVRPSATPRTLAAFLLISITAIGCSKDSPVPIDVHPVSGQVTFNGKPAAGAFVVFHPRSASGEFPAPRAAVDAQGNYSLSTFAAGDGAPPGEYTITVTLEKLVLKDGEFQPGPNLLPAQHAKARTSKLTASIASGVNTVPIKITR